MESEMETCGEKMGIGSLETFIPKKGMKVNTFVLYF
jgi:hypothetical protein